MASSEVFYTLGLTIGGIGSVAYYRACPKLPIITSCFQLLIIFQILTVWAEITHGWFLPQVDCLWTISAKTVQRFLRARWKHMLLCHVKRILRVMWNCSTVPILWSRNLKFGIGIVCGSGMCLYYPHEICLNLTKL